MQKLVILIDSSANSTAFQEGWPAFLALAERLPGLRKEAASHVEHVLAGRADFDLIHELFFDSMADMQAALASPTGKAAGKQLQEITRGRVTLLYADHSEDKAENLQRAWREPQDDAAAP